MHSTRLRGCESFSSTRRAREGGDRALQKHRGSARCTSAERTVIPQSYARTYYHFVWATWDRAPLLQGEVERHVYALIRQQCEALKCQVHALGGVEDHVHLVVSLPRTLCIADFMEAVKGGSSRALNEAALERGEGFKWQGGYGMLTVSQSDLKRVVGYAEGQTEHHRNGTLWPGSERVWED